MKFTHDLVVVESQHDFITNFINIGGEVGFSRNYYPGYFREEKWVIVGILAVLKLVSRVTFI